MRRRPGLSGTSRSSELEVSANDVWRVVANGHDRPQWYVDAAPFVARRALDRALGGAGRPWRPPGTPVLSTGDRAGFWLVEEADHAARRLVLRAEVRAPGEVRLESLVAGLGDGRSLLVQRVSFAPTGLLGRAYLVADLPAREVLLELVHRRLLDDVRRGT
ncbi:DUF2867 domain-containing protein [Nocardioides lianchengensis]|uniref:DUF2867 domain-containing protein n=1 Tax=Nocardioides lianchengensis TaxID=1045774 RepID=UPI000B88A2B4|nr:DUF2867 domain-containing protein [Nocardioides lianchengensis]NYG13503.1 hypothetical protein [Nocardioides lianchengensis]